MRAVYPLGFTAKRSFHRATVLLLPVALLLACTDRAQVANAQGALAEQQLSAGDIQGAKKSIAKAIAARDDVPELHLLRGRIALAQGSLAEAYDAYSDALSLDASNGEALQGVSQLGLSTGHLQESLQATDRILLLAPNQPDALLTRGVHALIRRRFDEAVTYGDKILSRSPADENASILKARALFLKGDTESALATMEAVSRNSGESAGIALTKLELFRELRRPNDMQAQFAILRSLRPKDLALRLDEANLHFKLGERATAQGLMTDVLSSPEASDINVNDAILLWVNYGVQDLRADQLGAIANNGTVFARQAVARLLLEAGFFDRAEMVIPSLRRFNRESLAARLLVARGNFQAGLDKATAILAQDKTQCDALVADSTANLGLKRWSLALQSGQLAAAECPEQVAGWIASAKAYEGLARSSGIERVYSQAFEAHPQDPRVVRAYAEWLLRQKRAREAVAIARRLTKNAPASLSAWRYYGETCRRTQSGCETDADRGFEDARTRFGVDLPVGAQAPNSLFGRFVRR
jgi:tetratricopeptide (TPR) repeat protein